MARTKNKSTNPILFWKPNQFPSARFRDTRWEPAAIGHAENTETDAGEDTDPDEAAKIEYLRNRFRNNEAEGFDCASGPSGCGPKGN